MFGLRTNKGLTPTTDASAIRTETFRGQTYTVVPVIALVETVLQGLNAAQPEFAPADEFAKFPVSWDGRPVTLDHPRSNGVLCSANDPAILEAYQIGFLANTHRDGDKLKSEAWIDMSLIAAMGDDAVEMMDRINTGEEFVEVSTGLFTDVVKTNGVFNGASYKLEWQGVVPDHLAFLPNSIGACSVADGCGAPRLNSVGTLVGGIVPTPPLNLGVVNAVNTAHECSCQKKEPSMNKGTTNVADIADNADVSGAGDATGAGAGSASSGTAGSAEGQDPNSDPAAAEPSGPTATVVTETTTVQDGVQTKETTTVTGTPEEVAAAMAEAADISASQQRLVASSALSCNAVPAGMTFENIREILRDAIRTRWPADTTCYDCCYYTSYIMALTSDMVAFEHRENGVYTNVAVGYTMDENGGVTFTGEPVPVNLIVSIVPKPDVTDISANSTTDNVETSGANQQQEEGHMATTPNGAAPIEPEAGGEARVNGAEVITAPKTLESFLADVPDDGMREMFQEALDMRNNARKTLITDIVSNSKGLFTEDELGAKSMDELRKLNTLTAAKPDYSGIAMPTGRQEGINANSQRDNQRSVPPAPKAFGAPVSRTIADTNAAGNAGEATVS